MDQFHQLQPILESWGDAGMIPDIISYTLVREQYISDHRNGLIMGFRHVIENTTCYN